MALSMADKLRQAAASRMAKTAATTTAILDGMDARASAPPSPQIRQENFISSGAHSEIQQTKPTVEIVRRNQQLNPAVEQLDSTVESNCSTDEVCRQVQQTNRPHKSSRQTDPTNPADKFNSQIRPLDPTDKNNATAGPRILTRSRQRLSTSAQKILAAYFLENGELVATYPILAENTGVPHGTVRCVIEKFVTHGWLCKTPWGAGSNRSLKLTPTEALASIQQSNSTDKPNRQTQQTNQTEESNSKGRLFNPTEESSRGNRLLKIDRKNLSISLETLQTSWPSLVQAGFGQNQIEQIERALAEQGKTTDRVIQALDHAEWELAEGRMLDKAGQPVADPCAWVFRSLASQGYYRRPAGYVSPEEQAERDAAEEAKALSKTHEIARQGRFRVWLQGLSVEQRKKVLEGRIGPEEAWLKKEWIKRGEPH